MPTNWTEAGNGGTSPVSPAKLSVAIANLNASEYPDTASTDFTYTDSAYWLWDGQPGCYDFWQCQNEYTTNGNVIVLPRSVPGATNVAVEHSSTMITLRKRWAAMREGAWPRVPPTDLGDPNWIFTNEFVGVREMRVAQDGVTIVYEASGVYEYQCLDASAVLHTAEVQPFLLPQPFGLPADPSAVVNWFDTALLSSDTVGLAGAGFGTGGQNPLGN